MSDEHKEAKNPETGAEFRNEGGADQVGSSEGVGATNAAATPDISETAGEKDQTASNAPDDDAEKGADEDHRREA